MEYKNIINLTPHTVKVLDTDGNLVEIPPSQLVARCSKNKEVVGQVIFNDRKIDIVKYSYNNIINVPEPQKGTLYLVSAIVKNALPDRADVVAVDRPERGNNREVLFAYGFRVNG